MRNRKRLMSGYLIILFVFCGGGFAQQPNRKMAKGQITDADLPIESPVELAGSASATKPEVKMFQIPIISTNALLNRVVFEEATKRGIDPLLVHALINQESGGNPRATSVKGAVGVMQLMPATARRFGVRDRHAIEESVRGGVQYLEWLLSRYDNDVIKALAGYNAGEGRVDQYGGVPPIRETQNYVKSIAARYRSLKGATIQMAGPNVSQKPTSETKKDDPTSADRITLDRENLPSWSEYKAANAIVETHPASDNISKKHRHKRR